MKLFLLKRDGKLFAYEIKWIKEAKLPSAWERVYPDSEFMVINKNNYLSWIK